MSAGRWVGVRLHWVFMFMIAVEPPHGDQDRRPGCDLRLKLPEDGPGRGRVKVASP